MVGGDPSRMNMSGSRKVAKRWMDFFRMNSPFYLHVSPLSLVILYTFILEDISI